MGARFSPEGLALGVTLLALGIVGTLSTFGVIEALPLVRRYWPLSLVIWGLLEIIHARAARAERARRTEGA